MTITAYPAALRADASALLAFDGPAQVLVAWSVVEGAGRVKALEPATDISGRAWAVFYPDGGSGPVRIRVEHGT